MLCLSTFFDATDVDYNSTRLLMDPENLDSVSRARQVAYCRKLALATRAVVGWYYLQEPAAAEKWGEKWLQPIVIRAHDIISEDPRYESAFQFHASII